MYCIWVLVLHQRSIYIDAIGILQRIPSKTRLLEISYELATKMVIANHIFSCSVVGVFN